jgi:thioredoxin reductase
VISFVICTLTFVITFMFDCIIVGGGPAGLSAALVLGRCRRRVLVCDAGRPRNLRAAAMHGFFSRDGIPPLELLAIAREQLAAYPNLEMRSAEVINARCAEGGFQIGLQSTEQFNSRALVLATGVTDELPQIAGLDELYGKSVFHCPYCDGWEWRERPLAVYGRGESGAGLTATLSNWSRDLVLCTDGPHELSSAQRRAVDELGAKVMSDRIEQLEGDAGQLKSIRFAGGKRLARDAMFVITRQNQASSLAAQLGCEDKRRRTVPTDDHQKAQIPGLYVVGDASRDVQMAIIAAAEGADAAFSINKYLLAQELPRELLA